MFHISQWYWPVSIEPLGLYHWRVDLLGWNLIVCPTRMKLIGDMKAWNWWNIVGRGDHSVVVWEMCSIFYSVLLYSLLTLIVVLLGRHLSVKWLLDKLMECLVLVALKVPSFRMVCWSRDYALSLSFAVWHSRRIPNLQYILSVFGEFEFTFYEQELIHTMLIRIVPLPW